MLLDRARNLPCKTTSANAAAFEAVLIRIFLVSEGFRFLFENNDADGVFIKNNVVAEHRAVREDETVCGVFVYWDCSDDGLQIWVFLRIRNRDFKRIAARMAIIKHRDAG